MSIANHLPFDIGDGLRRCVDLLAGHLAGAEANHFMSHRCKRGIMRDDHHGHALRLANILQQLQHFLAGLVIERTGRLIAQQQLRLFGNRAGDGYTLLFAAACGWMVPSAVVAGSKTFGIISRIRPSIYKVSSSVPADSPANGVS